MADAMMMFLGEAHGVNWYWAQPGEFENPGVYYWDGTKNVLCVPHLAAAPEAPAPPVVPVPQEIDVEGRRIAAEAENHACALAVWMTRMDAESLDADDLGVSGWLQEAEKRIKRRMLAAAPEAPAQASAADERAAFEAWAIDQPYIAAKNLWDERSRYGEEEYESHEVQLMWEAWQARAALAQKGGAS